MPVGAETEQDEVEGAGVCELDLVLPRALVATELALHPVDRLRLALEPVEQRRLRHGVVRPCVVRRDAALVSPPELDAAPVGLELGCELVGVARGRAAGEDDAAAGPDLLHQPLRDELRRLVRVGDDRDVDRAHPPSASSRARSMAAWIALRNAARTPACSSSRIAAIVVPPGDVTDSRSSTGCIFWSRSCFAVPNIVCTTSVVETSRESPSRIPASIIASARSAKYAGPEPETAVIASIQILGHAHDAAEVREQLLRERQLLVVGVRARADPRHALVHGGGRVRHRAHDRDAVCDPLLDVRGRDGGRDRDEGLLGRQVLSDLAEQDVDVLRFDGDDDDPGAGDRRRVVRGRLGAVAFVELGVSLVTPGRDDDLGGIAPAGAEQAGEEGLPDPAAAEDRDLALAHGKSL